MVFYKNQGQEEIRQISKYNEGGFSISRLNNCWIRCNYYIKIGSFTQWKFELDNIWLELIPDILRQKNKEELIRNNKKSMRKVALSTNRTELFFNLMQRHTFLRECQDIAGKAGVYVDEDREGFE